MSIKKLLLSIVVIGFMANNAMAVEENTPKYVLTHSTSDGDKSTSCTVTEDHIIYNTNYKKENDGSCWYSGPLMLLEINNTVKELNASLKLSEPLINQKELHTVLNHAVKRQKNIGEIKENINQQQ